MNTPLSAVAGMIDAHLSTDKTVVGWFQENGNIVTRHGNVVDGTGRAPFAADVAIDGGRIAQVGAVSARGREEIDARGKIVTPGFVDIRTHYDGQATWDSWIAPSDIAPITGRSHERL